jgi:Hydrolase of X-linked nucleoside diphosphate N terminal
VTPGPPPVLEWARRLAALAQSGLTFSPGLFDRDRYQQIRRLAAEMASHPGGDLEAVDLLFASSTGYATPKVICRAAVFDGEHRILMVRETVDGRWTLPGGWIDVGDTPGGAAER